MVVGRFLSGRGERQTQDIAFTLASIIEARGELTNQVNASPFRGCLVQLIRMDQAGA
jgi:hypothetical protein